MKRVLEDIDTVTKNVGSVLKETDALVDRYRRPVFSRFPVVFALLVSFGAAATFYGFERIIGTQSWLNERPWLILILGLLILALTGRLYKKLGE